MATVLGVSFAVFLMVFQGSLLAGFLQAASRFIEASDFDIWITARGVQAFEFGATLEARVREMAAGVPGVAETGRACMAFAVYRKPNGKQQVVALVGADSNLGKHFPVPDLAETTENRSPDSILYDASDRDLIEVASLPAEVEINGHRANIDHEIEVVNLRVVALGVVPKLELHKIRDGAGRGREGRRAIVDSKHAIHYRGQRLPAPIYDRYRLRYREVVTGPAVIIQKDSTALILPRHSGYVDDYGNILIFPAGRAPRRNKS